MGSFWQLLVLVSHILLGQNQLELPVNIQVYSDSRLVLEGRLALDAIGRVSLDLADNDSRVLFEPSQTFSQVYLVHRNWEPTLAAAGPGTAPLAAGTEAMPSAAAAAEGITGAANEAATATNAHNANSAAGNVASSRQASPSWAAGRFAPLAVDLTPMLLGAPVRTIGRYTLPWVGHPMDALLPAGNGQLTTSSASSLAGNAAGTDANAASASPGTDEEASAQGPELQVLVQPRAISFILPSLKYLVQISPTF